MSNVKKKEIPKYIKETYTMRDYNDLILQVINNLKVKKDSNNLMLTPDQFFIEIQNHMIENNY